MLNYRHKTVTKTTEYDGIRQWLMASKAENFKLINPTNYKTTNASNI